MTRRGRIYLLLLMLILFTNCIQYNVNLNFNYEKGLEIKESFIIDKSFFSITDSILSDSMFSDSYKIEESDSSIIISKTIFIDTADFPKHKIEYYKTKNDYFINIDPQSDIFIFNRKNIQINIFDSLKIIFTTNNGKILNNNADQIKNDTLIFYIDKNNIQNKNEYPHIRIRFANPIRNYVLIFIAFVIIGIIITLFIFIAKERH